MPHIDEFDRFNFYEGYFLGGIAIASMWGKAKEHSLKRTEVVRTIFLVSGCHISKSWERLARMKGYPNWSKLNSWYWDPDYSARPSSWGFWAQMLLNHPQHERLCFTWSKMVFIKTKLNLVVDVQGIYINYDPIGNMTWPFGTWKPRNGMPSKHQEDPPCHMTSQPPPPGAPEGSRCDRHQSLDHQR